MACRCVGLQKRYYRYSAEVAITRLIGATLLEANDEWQLDTSNNPLLAG
jgi:hypothetical protein